MRATVALLVLLTALLLPNAQAWAESRLALVIGNSDYATAPLANPVNDASLMAHTLREVGFEVTHLENATLREMERGVVEFSRTLAQAGEDTVSLIYYAGHGIQAEGENYLVPVDADIRDAIDVQFQALSATAMLRTIENANVRLSMLVMDACRNNPFPSSTRAVGGGLAEIDAPTGTLIAYATAPGQVAVDGTGRNSPYTRALTRAMRVPGLAVEQVFKNVRVAVMEATGDNQVPWEASSLTGDFFFSQDVANTAQDGGSDASDSAEIVFWDTIREGTEPRAFEAYLSAYPNGRFAAIAELKIEQLRAGPGVETAMVDSDTREEGGRTQTAVGISFDPGATFQDCAACPEMTVVPAGRFAMGSPEDEARRDADEGPVRTVVLSGSFAVSTAEITVDQFAEFADRTGHTPMDFCQVFTDEGWVEENGRNWRDPGFEQAGDSPVVCLSKDDIDAYTAWLSDLTGRTYRLLSEAEWEYAARAGTDRAYPVTERTQVSAFCRLTNLAGQESEFSWATNQCRDRFSHTAPTGSFRPNAFGLHDMFGNVWEWVADCWRDGYEDAPEDGSAVSEDFCEWHVARGGAYTSEFWHLRAAARRKLDPYIQSYDIGFRVAAEIPH